MKKVIHWINICLCLLTFILIGFQIGDIAYNQHKNLTIITFSVLACNLLRTFITKGQTKFYTSEEYQNKTT
jgi:ABC-type transport system involved in cytochrome bd biosynthesis fused ATPase/permease subunit